MVSWYVHTFHPNMSYPQKSQPAYDKHNITQPGRELTALPAVEKMRQLPGALRADACGCIFIWATNTTKHNMVRMESYHL